MLNIQELWLPAVADAPGGRNLDFTTEYEALERAARRTPERQVGSAVLPAEDPDWNAVLEQSSSLLKSSKDLRVAAHLARALLELHGFTGLADGLSLVREILDRFWTECYPRIEADEDNDATARVNAVATITHREFVMAVRSAPLLRSRGAGTVTVRDVERTTAESNGHAGPALRALLGDVSHDALAESARAVQHCSDEAARVTEICHARLGTFGPALAELRGVLAVAASAFSDVVPEKRAPDPAEGSHSARALSHSSIEGSRSLRSREDVLRILDDVCDYYARSEPSSPVPLLLRRCKRLAAMSFVDIVRDMLPDGLPTIETIAGKRSE